MGGVPTRKWGRAVGCQRFAALRDNLGPLLPTGDNSANGPISHCSRENGRGRGRGQPPLFTGTTPLASIATKIHYPTLLSRNDADTEHFGSGKGCVVTPSNCARLAVILAMLPCAGGCAVVMAVNGAKDPDVSALAVGQDRAVILATLGPPEKTYAKVGNRVDVFKLTRGDEPSAGRALAHGVMDLLTLCIWEVVGTPIEAVQGEEFHVSVEYDSDDRVVRLIPGIAGTGAVSPQQHALSKPDSAPEKTAVRPTKTPLTIDAKAEVVSVIEESRPSGSQGLLQRLFTSTSKEYAKKARIIANDAGLSDVEKLHSLATLSAVHAAEAKDSGEKETYTRLNENFLKRAQAIEERSVDQAIADDAITFPAGEPEERQAGYVEAASN